MSSSPNPTVSPSRGRALAFGEPTPRRILLASYVAAIYLLFALFSDTVSDNAGATHQNQRRQILHTPRSEHKKHVYKSYRMKQEHKAAAPHTHGVGLASVLFNKGSQKINFMKHIQ